MGRRASPVKRRKLRAKAASVVRGKTALARKGKVKRKPDKGRAFKVTVADLRKIGGADWQALVHAVKRELALTEEQLGWALKETARRLSKMRPTEDQIVGTFIEVVAAVSKPIRSTRKGMVRACLGVQIRDMILGGRNFFSNQAMPAGGLATAVDSDAFALRIGDLPLTATEKTQSMKRLQKREPGMSDQAWDAAVDAEVARLVDLVESKVVNVRDTEIGTAEFVDRAVLLPLEDGRLILLCSEEYKAPRSGGGGRQTALRINRLFNGNVAPGTPFTYTVTSNATIGQQMRSATRSAAPVTTTMDQLIIPSSTRGSDQILVKASRSGTNELEIATQRRSRKLAAQKSEYGDPVRAGKTVEVTYFKQLFSLPGRELRAVVKRLRKP